MRETHGLILNEGTVTSPGERLVLVTDGHAPGTLFLQIGERNVRMTCMEAVKLARDLTDAAERMREEEITE